MVAAAQLVAPALIVVGDVVRYRELLAPSALNGMPVMAVQGEDSRVEPEPAVFARVGSLSPYLVSERPREPDNPARWRDGGRRRRRPYRGHPIMRYQEPLGWSQAGIHGGSNG